MLDVSEITDVMNNQMCFYVTEGIMKQQHEIHFETTDYYYNVFLQHSHTFSIFSDIQHDFQTKEVFFMPALCVFFLLQGSCSPDKLLHKSKIC